MKKDIKIVGIMDVDLVLRENQQSPEDSLAEGKGKIWKWVKANYMSYDHSNMPVGC